MIYSRTPIMKKSKLLLSTLMCAIVLPLCACGNDKGLDTSSPGDYKFTGGAPQQTYIKDIKAVGAYWDKYAYNGAGTLQSKYGQEYTRLSTWNLNCDCGTTTDCIYLYESRTIHKEEAITDIIAVTQRDIPKNFVWNERNYETVGGIRVNGLNSSKTEYDKFDLNMNAGGDYIYLCVSRDQDKGKPVTQFKVGGISAFTNNYDFTFIYNETNKTDYQNFNAGAGGTAIYGAISCAITGWIINTITLKDRNKNFEEIESTIELNTSNKHLTAANLEPIIDKGEGAYFEGFYTKKVYSEGEPVTTAMEFPYDYTIWAKWKYDITIDYTALGGGIESFSKVEKFPYNNDYPLYYHVLKETGKQVSAGLCWPGEYVAVAY